MAVCIGWTTVQQVEYDARVARISNMKKKELNKALKRLGLKVTGKDANKKQQLIDHLDASYDQENEPVDPDGNRAGLPCPPPELEMARDEDDHDGLPLSNEASVSALGRQRSNTVADRRRTVHSDGCAVCPITSSAWTRRVQWLGPEWVVRRQALQKLQASSPSFVERREQVHRPPEPPPWLPTVASSRPPEVAVKRQKVRLHDCIIIVHTVGACVGSTRMHHGD